MKRIKETLNNISKMQIIANILTILILAGVVLDYYSVYFYKYCTIIFLVILLATKKITLIGRE